ncbi:MAG: DUF2662 domain-containing protein [Deltaproteobacteria bacterium]|nr:DUF2662 domain-containing protein [Deltaproteobacteria bacterium]
MGYMDGVKKLLNVLRRLTSTNPTNSLQPKEILQKVFVEIEKRKKLGIEDNPYVPNAYAVYLSPSDYEELSPFLFGIREQLIKKASEKIRNKAYKLLSSNLSIEIRQDPALEKNQVVVESSFLKEKATSSLPSLSTEADTSILSKETMQPPVDLPQKNILTKVIEEKKTKMIDNAKVKLEILEGTSKGDYIALKEGDYTFGRGREAAILLTEPEETISRVHFKLMVRDGRIAIKDLNSTNGTKVNGIGIENAELKKGDMISAGKVMLKVA